MLGIKNSNGKWLQTTSDLKHASIDTFGALIGARTFDDTHSAIAATKKLYKIGFNGLTIARCNPTAELTDTEIEGIIQDD